MKQAKQQRQADYRQRIPIEGKFGQSKNGFNLNSIGAKTARTSESWIHSLFLVMNLLVLARHFLVPESVLGWVTKSVRVMRMMRNVTLKAFMTILNDQIWQVSLRAF